MAILIRRSEALKKINQLEEKAAAASDKKGGEWIVKCFNAIMICKVEDRVFCAQCGKPVKAAKIPEDRGGVITMPGQMDINDFL